MCEVRGMMRPVHGGARGPQLMCEVRGMRPVHGGARGPQVDVRGQGHEAGAWWGEGTTG